MNRPPSVFMCYASEDREAVQAIYGQLRAAGLKPWMDKPPVPYSSTGIQPGETWKTRIPQEIHGADYLLAFLSPASVSKEGYVQREYRLALDRMNELPAGSVFMIPVMLAKCEPPALIVGHSSFTDVQWYDFYERGIDDLITYIRRLAGLSSEGIDLGRRLVIDFGTSNTAVAAAADSTTQHVRASDLREGTFDISLSAVAFGSAGDGRPSSPPPAPELDVRDANGGPRREAPSAAADRGPAHERAQSFVGAATTALDIHFGQLFWREALTLDQLQGSYEEQWTPVPESIRRAAGPAIEAKRIAATAAKVTFDNNPSYDLRRISVSRPLDSEGRRRNVYVLHFRPTDFYSYIYPNLHIFDLERAATAARTALDAEAMWARAEELRVDAQLVRGCLDFDNLDGLRARFRAGTNVVAVTRDGWAVLSVRSRRQLLASGEPLNVRRPAFRLHVSAPEGMLRSDGGSSSDNDVLAGAPHPGATVLRGLRKELGLHEGTHFRSANLRCLGWFMDRLRSQPVFVFFVALDATAADVCRLWDEGTDDAHENFSICCIPWHPEIVGRVFTHQQFNLLAARVPDKDDELFKRHATAGCEWASNHAKASTLIAAAHSFGGDAAARLSATLSANDQRPTN